MKVLLLSTPLNDAWVNVDPAANTGYPMGLPYLHAALEAHGHTVLTLPLNHVALVVADREIASALATFQPDVVGFNILSDSRVAAFAWIRRILAEYPQMQVLVGGVHATTMRRQIVEHFRGVIVVIGEGEVTTVALLAALAEAAPLHTVAGIAFHDGTRYVETAGRPLIDDLDQIPFPNHKLFFTPSPFQGAGRTCAYML
ncbi:MAG: cobalamin B12-binding domain-containing protein, partial [Magnetococcales bacterium]|nr:cobalamin B12-binding domain-containing protein [Magnetococcales bacterium]